VTGSVNTYDAGGLHQEGGSGGSGGRGGDGGSSTNANGGRGGDGGAGAAGGAGGNQTVSVTGAFISNSNGSGFELYGGFVGFRRRWWLGRCDCGCNRQFQWWQRRQRRCRGTRSRKRYIERVSRWRPPND